MIKSALGDRLDGWVRAVSPFLFRLKLNPNALTVTGTLVSLLSAAAFATGAFVWGGVLICAGGAFDLVDGVVARHQGRATRFGAFLDSTLDRLADMAILLGIAIHYAASGEPGRVLLAGSALIASALVSYAQARAEVFVPHFKVGLLERAERLLILTAGALTGFMVPALWIVLVGSAVTVAQRMARAYRELARIDADERAGLGEQT